MSTEAPSMKNTKGPRDQTYIQINRANWNDRVAIHLRDDAGFYRVEAFLNGKDVRPDIDREEMYEFAEDLKFEQAADVRNQIKYLKDGQFK